MKIKLNKRAYVFLAIIAIAVIVIIVAVSSGKKQNGEDETGTETRIEGDKKIITGEKLTEKKEFDGIEFSNIKFQIDNNRTTIFAEAKNTTSKTTDKKDIDFNVLDKDGNKIMTIGGRVESLAPGATVVVSTTRVTEENDAKAYNVEIVPQQSAEPTVNIEGENNNQENS